MVRDRFSHLLLALPLTAIVLCGCRAFRKSNPVEQADKFFSLVQQDRAAAAYQTAAFGFQARQSLPNFEANVRDLGFSHFVSCQWNRVVQRPDEVKLDGEIATREGSKFDIEATMARDRGEWRLYALRTHGSEALPTQNPFTLVGRGAAFQDVANRPVPPEGEIRGMARATIAQFCDAIEQKSFDDFYKGVSLSWQKQVSPKRLLHAFQPFIENKINLDEFGVRKLEPVFAAPPMVNGEGLLIVNGVFPTKPYRVAFSFKYMYEVPRWKLFGIDVNLLAPP